MTYRQEAERVLAQWREVERALEHAVPGSPDAERLEAEAARLRDSHRALIDAAERAQREELPGLDSQRILG